MSARAYDQPAIAVVIVIVRRANMAQRGSHRVEVFKNRLGRLGAQLVVLARALAVRGMVAMLALMLQNCRMVAHRSARERLMSVLAVLCTSWSSGWSAPVTAAPRAPAPARVPAPATPHRTLGIAAYVTPAVCFTSEISVFQNRDYDDGGYRADLAFRYKSETLSWSVPTDVGDTLAKFPHRVYKLCAVPTKVTDRDNAKPVMFLIEIWSGATLLWDHSYDFPITQKLAWSTDRRALLVELGRAMDDVFLTPLHGTGVVPVAAPDELRAKTLQSDTDYIVRVHIHERRAGASIELVEIAERTGESWTPVWTSTTQARP